MYNVACSMNYVRWLKFFNRFKFLNFFIMLSEELWKWKYISKNTWVESYVFSAEYRKKIYQKLFNETLMLIKK